MTKWQRTLERWQGPALLAVVLFALLVRVAAFLVLDLPVESDAAAYLTIANAIATTGIPADTFGQHGFYSIGYPMVLTPFVALFGAQPLAALLANLLLCLLTMGVLAVLARKLGMPLWGGLLALALYAVWLPGIWNACTAARENLSTPLLLLVLLASLGVLDRARGALFTAGAAWGAALLTGGSALLLGLAPLAALVRRNRRQTDQMLRGIAVMGGGLLVLLLPWMLAMQAMTGSFALNTSSGFNFYLGHNSAADGGFVSIAETPVGPRWHALHAELGEAGAGQYLAQEGLAYAVTHPGHTLQLAAVKLWRFWAPNVPDAADMEASALIAAIRWGDVVFYALLLLCAGLGLWRTPWLSRDERLVVTALIAGFWLVHVLAYVMPRYRDPVVPVLMLLAVLPFLHRREHARG